MYAEGHEVGVHTFTHSNMANVRSVTSAAGTGPVSASQSRPRRDTTSLLRLPYSAKVADVTFSEWQAMGRAGNYRVVYADLDTQDWKRPGVGAIVGAGLPRDGKGAVVMLPRRWWRPVADSGGCRPAHH